MYHYHIEYRSHIEITLQWFWKNVQYWDNVEILDIYFLDNSYSKIHKMLISIWSPDCISYSAFGLYLNPYSAIVMTLDMLAW